MNISTLRAPRAPTTGRALLALAVAVSLVGLIAPPAYADEDRGARDDHERGARDNYEHGSRDSYEHGTRGYHDGERRDHRGYDRHRDEYRRYPVYAPDPIYYPRQESPGINLFLPFWDRDRD